MTKQYTTDEARARASLSEYAWKRCPYKYITELQGLVCLLAGQLDAIGDASEIVIDDWIKLKQRAEAAEKKLEAYRERLKKVAQATADEIGADYGQVAAHRANRAVNTFIRAAFPELTKEGE